MLVHPTLGVGYYDAVRFTGVTLRYRDGHRPLPDYREANLRGTILHELTESALAAGTTIAKNPGACVVDVKVAVLNIDLKGVGRTGAAKRSLGSATLAYDMRDSATGEPLVTLAGKRDFGPGLDKSGRRDDFKRLSKNVGDLMVVLGQSLGYVVSDEISAREGVSGKPGCNGELRKSAAAARAVAAWLDAKTRQDKLQEAGGIEANVATGYHAVEFLLWGQDLNGTEAGAGERPYTDYAAGDDCTGGHCDRRGQYLDAAADLLVADLEEMVGNWTADGAARKALLDDPTKGLSAILTGMGSLSYGELAGERMKLGLLLHDPEEEHDCFSDNTHVSHLNDVLGIRNVYTGKYERVDGTMVEGPAIADLVAAKAPEIDKEIRADLDDSVEKFEAISKAAEDGEAYDQQIGEGNDAGNARVQAGIDALITQTRAIERAVAALDLGGVTIEGSDSLDNTEAVFQ